MSGLNIKDFLTCGSFLQIGPDLFKVILGPFERIEEQHLLEFSSSKHSTVLFKPNFWDFLDYGGEASPKSVYFGSSTYILDREEFIGLLSGFEIKKPKLNWNPPPEDLFQAQFEWSRKNFLEHRLEKAVPIICQQADGKMMPENLAWCLLNLLKNRHFGWSYGYFENNAGIIGHTPELLVNWMKFDGQLHTAALAGTYENKGDAHNQILNDQKIRREHQIVIDDINEKLKKLNLDIMQDETEVLELKHLLHLYTQFQISIDNIGAALRVMDQLHPTSAMGLYPFNQDKFREFAKFKLQKERGSFAAPFAFIELDAVYCVVAIRNIIFKNDQVQIFSGCGVTSESQYDQELTELSNKRESVKKMMGLTCD